MINVLLVDDEVLAMDYLESMVDWESMGFKVAGKVTNGKRAIGCLKHDNIKLIISDIRMQVMDGIALAEYIKKHDIAIKVILISAYKDFQYAKSAIQYGVTNYLLKHELTKERIEEELSTIKALFEKEERFIQYNQKELLEKLIYKREINSQTIDSVFQGTQIYYVMLLLTLNESFHNQRRQNMVRLNELTMNINRQSLSCLTQVQIDDNHLIMLIGINRVAGELLINQELQRTIDEVFSEARKRSMYDLRIVYTHLMNLTQADKNFRQLAVSSRYSRFMSFGISYEANSLPVEKATKLEFDKLMDLIEKAEMNEAVIHDIFYLISNPKWKLELLKEAIKHLEKPEKKDGFKDYNDLKKAYQESYAKKIDQQKYSVIVREIFNYINDHYMEKITLQKIGSYFDMNGVYLGQVFKKEVEKTVLQYLNEYRMDRAKQKLLTTTMNINEVSRACGFLNSQYFSTVFIKTVGLSPQDFRKWGKKCEENI